MMEERERENLEATGIAAELDSRIAYYQEELDKIENKKNFPYVYIVVAIPTTAVFLLLTVISQGLINFTTGITGALFFSLLITCFYLVLFQPSREELAKEFNYQIKNLHKEKAKLESGQRGEREVQGILKLLGKEYIVLNNLSLPAPEWKPQQLDHVVIGPQGVTHLETKSLNGALIISPRGEWSVLRARQNRVFREGIESPRLQVERHERVLRQLAERALPGRSVPINSLVVMSNPQTIIEGQDPILQVLKKDRLLDAIRELKIKKPLGQQEVRRLALALVTENLEVEERPLAGEAEAAKKPGKE